MPLSPSPVKTYIDVMVFIYHLLYDKSLDVSKKSEKFFKDIESGAIVGVVSSFTIMEYVGVMKRFVSEKKDRPLTIEETLMMKQMLIEFLSSLGIMLYNSDSLIADATGVSSLFSDSEILIENHVPVQGLRDRKWHTLCGADSLHSLFAIRTNSSYLATFDDDFQDIKDQLKILNIWEEY